jgi:hypothetical protein
MKDITVSSNFGRFATRITTEVGEEVNEKTTALCVEGLSSLLFRQGGSAGEKAIIAVGGVDANGVAVSKDSKRADIPYTKERASAFIKSVNETLNGEKSKFPTIIVEVTGEHVYGEDTNKPSKEAKEQWASVKDNEKAHAKLGLVKPFTQEDGVLALHRYLVESKRKAALEAKNALV